MNYENSREVRKFLSSVLAMARAIETGTAKKIQDGRENIEIRTPDGSSYVSAAEAATYLKNVAEQAKENMGAAGRIYRVGFFKGRPVEHTLTKEAVLHGLREDMETLSYICDQLRERYSFK